MKENNGLLSTIKKMIGQGSDQKKTGKSYQYLALVLLTGVVIMLIGSLSTNQVDKASTEPALNKEANQQVEETVDAFSSNKSETKGPIDKLEHTYEQRIKTALEDMRGVSDVTVVVNLDATERKVYEKNLNTQKQNTEEIDKDGGKRNVEEFSTEDKTVIIRDGNNEVPLIIETKKASIRGVLVVAKGAGNIETKREVIEAVTRVLDVPSHRVAVMAKK